MNIVKGRLEDHFVNYYIMFETTACFSLAQRLMVFGLEGFCTFFATPQNIPVTNLTIIFSKHLLCSDEHLCLKASFFDVELIEYHLFHTLQKLW